jgi:hypothetical protein
MALPTTNRTGHWDASDADRLFTATTLTGAVSNGSSVRGWDDEGDAFDLAFMDVTLGTTVPTWVSSAINSLGALDFDGTDDSLRLRTDSNTGGPVFDTVFNVNAKTLFIVFQMEGNATNQAAPYDNTGLFAEDGGYFGMYLKTNGSVHSALAYNFASGAQETSITISQNVPYVAMLKHDGSTLSIEARDGTNTLSNSVSSGNTNASAARVHVGRGFAAAFFNGKVGEIATYDAALTGTDLTDAWSYFTTKWLAAGSSPAGPLLGGRLVGRGRLLGGRLVS